MKTEPPDPTGHGTDSRNLSADALATFLGHDRRRRVLRYLSETAGPVSLGELAEQISVREGDPTYEGYERILIGLHHAHLPKLADAGVVRYDVERETIELARDTDQVTPYLDVGTAEGTAEDRSHDRRRTGDPERAR